MAERRVEVAVHALPSDVRVDGLRQRWLRLTLVVGQDGVQHDLEGVHAELKLSAYRVDELQLHVAAAVVGQRDEAPAVLLRVDFDQLLDVSLLQGHWGDLVLIDALGQKVQQDSQHHILHQPELGLTGQVHPEDEIQIFVAPADVLHQHVAGGGAVEPDVLHPDAAQLQVGAHPRHDVLQLHL